MHEKQPDIDTITAKHQISFSAILLTVRFHLFCKLHQIVRCFGVSSSPRFHSVYFSMLFQCICPFNISVKNQARIYEKCTYCRIVMELDKTKMYAVENAVYKYTHLNNMENVSSITHNYTKVYTIRS